MDSPARIRGAWLEPSLAVKRPGTDPSYLLRGIIVGLPRWAANRLILVSGEALVPA
jgi:hypothetical protein